MLYSLCLNPKKEAESQSETSASFTMSARYDPQKTLLRMRTALKTLSVMIVTGTSFPQMHLK